MRKRRKKKERWLPWLVVGGVTGLIVVVVGVVVMGQRSRLREALEDDNPAVRAAAIRGMSRLWNQQLLYDRLEDEDADVRCVAADRLGGPGSNREGRARALVGLLKDPHPGVRRQAAWSLARVGPDAWPTLQQALKDENPIVRAGAALALGDAYTGSDGWPPRPSKIAKIVSNALHALRGDPDPEVQRNVALALKRTQP